MSEDLAMPISIVTGILSGIWVVAWMWHIGPSGPPYPVWWAVPYWLTSGALGGATVALIAIVLPVLLQHRVRR